MNLRIKELKIRACKWASENASSTEYENEADQKFAELIVRECVDIAYEYDAPKMSGPGMIIAGRIETHFGIEDV